MKLVTAIIKPFKLEDVKSALQDFGVTWIIGTALDRTLGFRISRDAELEGIDLTEHAETAYEFEGALGGGFAGGSIASATKVAAKADEEVSA